MSKYLSAYFRRRRMEFMSQIRSFWYFSIILLSIPQSSLSFQLAILHSLSLPVNRCSRRLPITVRLYTSRGSSPGAHLNKPIDLSFQSLSDGSILLSLHFSPLPALSCAPPPSLYSECFPSSCLLPPRRFCPTAV